MEKTNIAFCFPGIGVKPSGFEGPFFLRHRECMLPFISAASEASGFNCIAALEGNNLSGIETAPFELLTCAFGAAMAAAASGAGFAPKLTAGYSFGLYAALIVSGALSCADGLRLAGYAGEIVEERSAGKNWGMGLTLGLTIEEIRALLLECNRPSLKLVNRNNESCVVVAGHLDDIDLFLREASFAGALRAETLPVKIPYHHAGYLDGLPEKLSVFMRSLEWKTPVIPVVSSIDQSPLTTIDGLQSFTAKNIASPINWMAVVETLHRQGVECVIECGPGISLYQNARFSGFPMDFVNTKNILRKLSV